MLRSVVPCGLVTSSTLSSAIVSMAGLSNLLHSHFQEDFLSNSWPRSLASRNPYCQFESQGKGRLVPEVADQGVMLASTVYQITKMRTCYTHAVSFCLCSKGQVGIQNKLELTFKAWTELDSSTNEYSSAQPASVDRELGGWRAPYPDLPPCRVSAGIQGGVRAGLAPPSLDQRAPPGTAAQLPVC